MLTVMKVGVYRDGSRCLQGWKSMFKGVKVGVYSDECRC